MKGVEEGGILVRLVGGAGEIKRILVKEETDLSVLDLSNELLEGLGLFWRSGDQIYFSPENSKGVGGKDVVRVAAERLVERRRLLVFGAGHVGQSVAVMGAVTGLKVVLFDDRDEFLKRMAVAESMVQCILGDFNRIDGAVRISRNSAVVIVTRGHQCDEVILRQIADYDASYVGMIGSRRRVEAVFRRLREQGVSDLFLKRVRAPIGLDIGAKTPQEIAVSIHAEIIRHFNSASSQVG